MAAPAWVSAARDARGDVLVLWAASTTPDVTYRVSRQRPDGRWQVLGRTDSTSLDDGGAPVGVEVPVYAVVALQAGRGAETRSDAVQAASAPAAPSAPPPVGPRAPDDVRAVRVAGGAVRVSWIGSGTSVPGAQPDPGRAVAGGRAHAGARHRGWRRAEAGPVPAYAVSAAANGERSAEARSDGVHSDG